MRQIKLLSLALLATFAFAAIAANIAQAEEAGVPLIYLPSGRNPTAREPATFSAVSQEKTIPTLETARSKIECEKNEGKGEFTSGRHGTTTVTFTGCKALGVSCGSLGDAVGTVLAGGPTTLVDLEIGSRLVLGVLIELTREVHLECPSAGVLILVRRAVIGVFVGLPEPAAGTVTLFLAETSGKAELLFEKGSRAGEQKQKTCHLAKETCEGKSYNLETTFGRGSEETAAISEELLAVPTSYLIEY
jgi:hypothetical protein